MESEGKERVKAGDKRTRDLVSSVSSVSEADSSINEAKIIKQKKKKQREIKKIQWKKMNTMI